ncbi:hypothetical protein EDB82DRAFT_524880 [Fusarium venenatum]|uniref:uncharacterized protein n=1 Tax=Fusarium venenatum TaxID=56646 RepID=UPI001DEBEB97|nr:hypothetical protein EDB82DRAFT_524880 [Fusarium venenatum]
MPDNRTILGPLTESWAYPTACGSLLYLPDCSTCTVASQAQKCNTAFPTTINDRENFKCWPPATPPNGFIPPVSGWGIYKPATKCPEGFTVACTAEGTTKSDFEFQFEVNDDEFVRGCCPSHYECANTILRSVTAPTRFTIETRSTVTENITVHAPMFQLAGLKRLEPVSTTSTSTWTETPASHIKSDSGGGLSTGAQAGIGVGVGVIGLGIIGAAFYLWRRRGRSPKSGLESSQLDSQEIKPPGELGGTPLSPPPQYTPVELDGTPARQELP